MYGESQGSVKILLIVNFGVLTLSKGNQSCLKDSLKEPEE
jgi:hypothetical protein